jgi:hypothetical protein
MWKTRMARMAHKQRGSEHPYKLFGNLFDYLRACDSQHGQGHKTAAKQRGSGEHGRKSRKVDIHAAATRK